MHFWYSRQRLSLFHSPHLRWGIKKPFHLIYCFHMPLFFIISGYLFNFDKWKLRFKDFFKSRVERLIIPYFLTALFFFYPFWFFLERHFGEEKNLNIPPIKEFLGIFYGSAVDHYMTFNTPLWFLPCLFISEIIFFFVLKYINKIKLQTITIFFISAIGVMIGKFYALPWSFDVAMVVQIFFLFGYILKTKKININFIIGLIALIIVLVDVYFFGRVDTATRHYNNVLMYFIGGISGTSFILWISNLIAKIKYISKVFYYLGIQSMTVFMWHNFGFKFASILFVYGMGIPLTFAHENYYILYTIIATIVSLTILHTKNKAQNILKDKGHAKSAQLINW